MRQIAYTFFAFLLFYGCTELYEPEIFTNKSFLVVEGLITNDDGPYVIKLSRTGKFGDNYQANYEGGAILTIADPEGNMIDLTEGRIGYYYTPVDFTGQIDETYTLHIETRDGSKYESEPQKMMKPICVDSLYGEFGTKTFTHESHVTYEIYQREVDGVNMLLDVSCDEEEDVKFRFTSILMLQYMVEEYMGWRLPFEYHFCWIKKPINNFIGKDISEKIEQTQSKRNMFAFIPENNRNYRYLGFPMELSTANDKVIVPSYTNPRIIFSLYTLNDDAYRFYYDKNAQLSNEGSFFDPIAPQLTGNIYNIYDPDDIVLGFFEVSSVSNVNLHIKPRININVIEIDTVNSVEHVPAYDCIFQEIPEWWL